MDINIQTIKEFNNDSYKTELNTKILNVFTDEKDGKVEVTFEKTIFHPQGGGQPSDEGYIIVNSNKINVLSLFYDRDKDIIKHKLDLSDNLLVKVQDEAKLYINAEKRLLYARLHSAGHLLDIAVSKLGLNLKPGKGFHFPESPYVEYEGTIEEDKAEKNTKNDVRKFTKITDALQKTANDLIISANRENTVISKIYSYEVAKTELQLPKYLPEGKDVRWVKLLNDDPGCPCGGTHLKHINEIGTLLVTKIVKKGKNIRICYNLQ